MALPSALRRRPEGYRLQLVDQQEVNVLLARPSAVQSASRLRSACWAWSTLRCGAGGGRSGVSTPRGFNSLLGHIHGSLTSTFALKPPRAQRKAEGQLWPTRSRAKPTAFAHAGPIECRACTDTRTSDSFLAGQASLTDHPLQADLPVVAGYVR